MSEYTVDELLVEIECDIEQTKATLREIDEYLTETEKTNPVVPADYSHRINVLRSKHARLQTTRNTLLQYREERNERITTDVVRRA